MTQGDAEIQGVAPSEINIIERHIATSNV